MVKAVTLREYKADEPLKTINRIRRLISNIGLKVLEENISNDENSIYSCRLRVVNDGLFDLDIGTNGKGVSPEYSLASAYGELMERLQNSSLFTKHWHMLKKNESAFSSNSKFGINKDHSLLEFNYFPDEVTCKGNHFDDQVLRYFTKVFEESEEKLVQAFHKIYSESFYTGVSFYNVSKRRVEILPYELIKIFCTTNGMCAGNTEYEALMQGLSECFERYVIGQVFMKHIELPNIPLEYFLETNVYKKIQKLQEDSYTVMIKDGSLDLGIPVLILILLNRKTNKYLVCAGSDPSPEIALERCLTELYQGGISGKMNYFSFAEDPFVEEDKERHKKRMRRCYYDNLIYGTGGWPEKIFSNKESSVPLWHQFRTERENFEYYVALVNELGYEVFIRDCSNLGFNTYHIYVPGMSEIYFKDDLEGLNTLLTNYQRLSDLIHLYGQDDESKKVLFDSIKVFKTLQTPSPFKIEEVLPPVALNSEETCQANKINFVIPYKLEDFKDSAKMVDEFIKENNYLTREDRNTKLILKEFLELLNLNYSKEKALLFLSKFISEQQLQDLKFEIGIMEDYFVAEPRLFDCYNCENCLLRSNCKILDQLKILKRIQKRMKEKVINQDSVRKLFMS